MKDGQFWLNTSLIEASVDPIKKEIAGILLVAGKSQRKNYYAPNVVEMATPMFEGVKMYIDHPDEKDVGKTRSIRDWAATIKEAVYDPAISGTRARIAVRDPWLWENRVLPAHEGGFMEEIGISINAVGPTRLGAINGEQVRIVEGIRKVFSVDFVTEASAGGKVTQMLESAEQELEEELAMLKNLTLDELIESRPDLIQQIIQESADGGGVEDEEDVMITEGLLECVQMLTSDVQELQSDVAEVIGEFAEGLNAMYSDVQNLMEGAGGYEGDDDYLTEGGYDPAQAHYVVDPEIYEEISVLRESVQELTEANERMRNDMLAQSSYSVAVNKLQESNLPLATQERLLPAMIYVSSDEMDALIESEWDHLSALQEELGGIPIVGAGGVADYDQQVSGTEASQDRLDTLINGE